MANMNQMGRDLDALHVKVDAILDALGVTVDDARQKRLDAQEKARKAYMPGGKGWKQIHSNPHGEDIEPAMPEGEFVPATIVADEAEAEAPAADEPKKPAANAKK